MKILTSIVWVAILHVSSAHSFQPDMSDERHCLATNIYFEAANQSDAGKLAVAYVTINRARTLSRWENSICGVVHEGKTFVNWKGNVLPIRNKCQFSWYCDGKPDEIEDSPTWLKCLKIAELALYDNQFDITSGSTHYHTRSVNPYWRDQLEHTVTIDDHIFYK
jgi:N-acetylmuramoyl-L-alanine amidase